MRVTAAIFLVASALLGAAAPAVAAVTPNPRGHFLGVVPHSGQPGLPNNFAPALAGGNVTYHGGPVMHTNRTHAIFWAPPGFAFPSSYQALIVQYLNDVAADSHKRSNVYSVHTQYTEGTASGSPPAAYDSTNVLPITATDALPANGCPPRPGKPCISDMQLQQEVAQVITANSLPKGLSDVYFLFLPPGVDSCDANNTSSCSYNVYCAYHSHFPEGGPTAGTVLYADQPFTGPGCSHSERPNGEPSDADSQLSVLSHEHIETVTDPLGTGWWDSATGDEIADKCINYGAALGGTAGARFNQVIAGNDYYLQQEWSNADNACAQRANKPPHAVISFQPQNPDPNTEVMFDGTASSDPDGTISTDPDAYTWTFGDGTAAAVGPTLRHTYTRNGVYTVTLVVKDDLGFTGTTSVSLRVGPPPPPPPVDQPPSCTASSATVAEGSSVAVSLTCSDPDGDTLSRTVTAPPAHGVLGDVDQSTGMVFYSPDPGYSGPDSFQFAADDGRGGVAPSATASISVEPPPSSPPPPTTPGPTAPSNPIDEPPLFADVASLSVKPRSFRAARSGPSAAASSGAAVRFVLEGTFGQVEFRIQRVVPGVRTAGGKCIKRSASTRRHSPCPLLVSVPGSFARPGVEGASTFRFTGRLQGRTLSPGTYRLRAAAGTGGITARASFVILH